MAEGWTGELRGVKRGGERLLLPAPFGKNMKLFAKIPLGEVLTLFLVELSRGVKRAGEPLMLSV